MRDIHVIRADQLGSTDKYAAELTGLIEKPFVNKTALFLTRRLTIDDPYDPAILWNNTPYLVALVHVQITRRTMVAALFDAPMLGIDRSARLAEAEMVIAAAQNMQNVHWAARPIAFTSHLDPQDAYSVLEAAIDAHPSDQGALLARLNRDPVP